MYKSYHLCTLMVDKFTSFEHKCMDKCNNIEILACMHACMIIRVVLVYIIVALIEIEIGSHWQRD